MKIGLHNVHSSSPQWYPLQHWKDCQVAYGKVRACPIPAWRDISCHIPGTCSGKDHHHHHHHHHIDVLSGHQVQGCHQLRAWPVALGQRRCDVSSLLGGKVDNECLQSKQKMRWISHQLFCKGQDELNRPWDAQQGGDFVNSDHQWQNDCTVDICLWSSCKDQPERLQHQCPP